MKKVFLTIVTFGLVLSSCAKKEDADTTPLTSDEAKVSAQIDLANDDVSTIVQSTFENPDATTLSNKNSTASFAACATISRVPAFGSTPAAGTQVTTTVDFGTGCTLQNGNVVSGKIIISYEYPAAGATSVDVNYVFNNFTHNGHLVTGTKHFVFTKVAATTTAPIIPQHWKVVMNMDLNITINGVVYHRVGSRTTEITAGYNQPLADREYTVTGNWTTTPTGGSAWTSSITTPLLVKMSCMNVNKPLLVQGVITFVRDNSVATLNYGSGNCDNLAVFTFNGNDYNIIIGN